MLRSLCHEQPRQWHRFINPLMLAYREQQQENIGFSAFELLYGRAVRGPVQILKELRSKEEDAAELLPEATFLDLSLPFICIFYNNIETILYIFNQKFSVLTVFIPNFFPKINKCLFQKYILNAKQRCSFKRNQFLYRTLRSLSRSFDIKICKFDKGRGVAVLNSEDYYAKLDLIVSDTSKFGEIPIKEHETHSVMKKKTPSATTLRII